MIQEDARFDLEGSTGVGLLMGCRVCARARLYTDARCIVIDLEEPRGFRATIGSQRAELCSTLHTNFGEFPFLGTW
jgi:hypothetical protein